jgi:demethylmenaquinone methyltransferase/2-methoxy-6-polyprenyl-1,4-benzoquinol methylase
MHQVRNESQIAEAAAAGGEGKELYVRRMFSAIAPRYDLLNHLLSFNIDRRWRRAAIATLGIHHRPAGCYLDLCAGTLDIAAAIQKSPGFSGQVVAADFSEPMLRAGVHKVDRARVSAVAADALALPVADESFDGAIVAFGIRNVAGLDGCLREVLRVLRRGARFVILEFSTPQSALVRFGYGVYSNNVLPLVGRLISGHRTAYRYLPESVARFPEQRVLAAIMHDAGFRSVQWHALSFGIAAIHVGEKT